MRIFISSMAGDTIELDMEPESTTLQLKERLASSWSIPPICQVLLSGSEVLSQDSANLVSLCRSRCDISGARYCDDSMSLSLTMLLSLDDLCKNLDRRRRPVLRKAALEAAGILLSRNESCFETRPRFADSWSGKLVISISTLLEDPDSDIRSEVVDLLKASVNRGEDHFLATVTAHLKHTDVSVKRSAVRVLSLIASEEEERSTALRQCLEDSDFNVRYEAMLALSQLAENGDHHALAALTGAMDNVDCDLRRVAVESCGRLADLGSEEALMAISASLDDSDVSIRMSATGAFRDAMKDGSEIAIAAMCQRLRHSDRRERLIAIQMLAQGPALTAQSCPPVGEDVVSALSMMSMADPDDDVREEAALALLEAADAGNTWALAELQAIGESA